MLYTEVKDYQMDLVRNKKRERERREKERGGGKKEQRKKKLEKEDSLKMMCDVVCVYF